MSPHPVWSLPRFPILTGHPQHPHVLPPASQPLGWEPPCLPHPGQDTFVTRVQGVGQVGSVGARAGKGDVGCCPRPAGGGVGVRGLLRGHWERPPSLCPTFRNFLPLHRAELQLPLHTQGCGWRWWRGCFTPCLSFPGHPARFLCWRQHPPAVTHTALPPAHCSRRWGDMGETGRGSGVTHGDTGARPGELLPHCISCCLDQQ